MSTVNELALVERYHTLATTYQDRPIVARRNTIPALLSLVASPTYDVRMLAAETILMLCEHPSNPPFLLSQTDLMSVIHHELLQLNARGAGCCEGDDIQKIFESILGILQLAAAGGGKNLRDEERPTPGCSTSSRDTSHCAVGVEAETRPGRGGGVLAAGHLVWYQLVHLLSALRSVALSIGRRAVLPLRWGRSWWDAPPHVPGRDAGGTRNQPVQRPSTFLDRIKASAGMFVWWQ